MHSEQGRNEAPLLTKSDMKYSTIVYGWDIKKSATREAAIKKAEKMAKLYKGETVHVWCLRGHGSESFIFNEEENHMIPN